MKHSRLAVPLLAGTLLLGGATACSQDEGAGVEDEFDVGDEDITPGVNPGEEPVVPGPS